MITISRLPLTLACFFFGIFFGFMAMGLTPASAAPSCDDLAALAADPMAKSDPVDFKDLEANLVIETCLDALSKTAADDPMSNHSTDAMIKGRLLLNLGRGYLAAGQTAAAKQAFVSARELDYPAAYFALGVFYLVGEDGTQNLPAAHLHLTQALDKGVVWAARALVMLHQHPDPDYYSPEKAAAYQDRWQAQN